MTPEQLTELAGYLRSAYPAPAQDQAPHVYVRNLAFRALADGISDVAQHTALTVDDLQQELQETRNELSEATGRAQQNAEYQAAAVRAAEAARAYCIMPAPEQQAELNRAITFWNRVRHLQQQEGPEDDDV